MCSTLKCTVSDLLMDCMGWDGTLFVVVFRVESPWRGHARDRIQGKQSNGHLLVSSFFADGMLLRDRVVKRVACLALYDD